MLRGAMNKLVLIAACLACTPPAKTAEVPRSAVGTEQARLTTMLMGPTADEATATGLARELVQDDAWVVEAGTRHTCVAFVTRTPRTLSTSPATWTFEIDGAPITPDLREPSYQSYAFVGDAPGKTDVNVVVDRGVICGPPHPTDDNVSFVIHFRQENIEWYERFEWKLKGDPVGS